VRAGPQGPVVRIHNVVDYFSIMAQRRAAWFGTRSWQVRFLRC
jgi:hypothetical protein